MIYHLWPYDLPKKLMIYQGLILWSTFFQESLFLQKEVFLFAKMLLGGIWSYDLPPFGGLTLWSTTPPVLEIRIFQTKTVKSYDLPHFSCLSFPWFSFFLIFIVFHLLVLFLLFLLVSSLCCVTLFLFFFLFFCLACLLLLLSLLLWSKSKKIMQNENQERKKKNK